MLLTLGVVGAVPLWQSQGTVRLSHWWLICVGHGRFDVGVCTREISVFVKISVDSLGNFEI